MTSHLAQYDPRRTYNAAAVDYDNTSARFWRYAAEETVRRLALQPGERLLDVACGPGAAALAAAREVGPDGAVLGIDIAEEMISLARIHAIEQQALNTTFAIGDMNALDCPAGSFDAVTCVFGLFFAEDIIATIRAMTESLVFGGRIAITTLGPEFFSPMFEVFVDAAVTLNPAIDTKVPWRRTQDPDDMRDYLTCAGVADISVNHEVSELTLRSPEDWWRIVMGTGIRRLAMDLNVDALNRVREHNLSWIRDHQLSTLEFGVIYCRGDKL
jgi:ubiquinone/menaquinone biosynthesis C-methylase UbiE